MEKKLAFYRGFRVTSESEEQHRRYGRHRDSGRREECHCRNGRHRDSSSSEEHRGRYGRRRDSSSSEEHRGRYDRRRDSSSSEEHRGRYGRRRDSSSSEEHRGRYGRRHDSSSSEEYSGRYGRRHDSSSSEEHRGRDSRDHRGQRKCEREEHDGPHDTNHVSSGSEEHHGLQGGHNGSRGSEEHLSSMERRHQYYPDPDTYVYGRCDMAMNPTLTDSPHNITGVIIFKQKVRKPLEVFIDLEGFSMSSMNSHHKHEHGFHVHQFGDLTDGCQSFGGHFNPEDVTHGSPNSDQRHAGDWGNIACDDEGKVRVNLTDHKSYLVGSHSIIGRGIVIHAHRDDLGLGGVPASLKTGNAGPRLACCPIVWWKGID